VKDAQAHESDDQVRRDVIDARNQADSLAYQVEKVITENRDKLPVGELSRAEEAIAHVRAATQTDDAEAIKKAADELQRISHGFAAHLYKSSQSQGQSSTQGSDNSNVKDGEVVDAEYAETA